MPRFGAVKVEDWEAAQGRSMLNLQGRSGDEGFWTVAGCVRYPGRGCLRNERGRGHSRRVFFFGGDTPN